MIDYGYVPNCAKILATELFRRKCVPWDEFSKPPVCDYAIFRERLKEREEETRKLNEQYCFWPHVIAKKFGIPAWESHQGNLGSCTSFGVKNATHCKMMIQKAKNAELLFEEINPFHTFALSKGGSTHGGQSLSEIANAYNDYGGFAVSDVGKYDAGMNGDDVYDLPDETFKKAKNRQVGFTEIDVSKYDPVEELFFLSKNHVPCIIGNYNTIGRSKVDENGVRVGVIDGRGAHCTATCGSYRKKNGVEYIGYAQSWGNTFSGGDDPSLPQ